MTENPTTPDPIEYRGLEAEVNIEYERDISEELSVSGTLVREVGLGRGV
jgi:hypothetical protein